MEPWTWWRLLGTLRRLLFRGVFIKVARAGWRRDVTVAMVIKWRPYVQKWCSP